MNILTVKESAEYLKVSERRLKELLAQKQIPAGKVGNTWRIAQEDIDAFVRNGGEKPSSVPTTITARKPGRPRKHQTEGAY